MKLVNIFRSRTFAITALSFVFVLTASAAFASLNFGTDSIVSDGALVLSPTGDTGVRIGPPESDLNPHLRGYFGAPYSALITSLDGSGYSNGLEIESEQTDPDGSVWGLTSVSLGFQTYAVEGDAWTNADGGMAFGVNSYAVARDGADADLLVSLHAWSNYVSEGSTVVDSIGLQVDDQSVGTNNWAIKTGLGKVELGDTLTTKNGGNVASVTTTALPGGNLFHITGTTNITTLNSCNAANNGRSVILIFDGILTFTDGNNLNLAGNFVTTAGDTITLVCDGSAWFETLRSVN